MKKRLWYALDCPPTLRQGFYAVARRRIYTYQLGTYRRLRMRDVIRDAMS